MHKSLVRGVVVPAAVAAAAASASPSSRSYRPRRRMSLHRGTAGMVPTMTMTEGGGGGNDLNKSEVAAIMSARLEGGESDIIELPTINATVVQRSGGVRGKAADEKVDVVTLKGTFFFSSFFFFLSSFWLIWQALTFELSPTSIPLPLSLSLSLPLLLFPFLLLPTFNSQTPSHNTNTHCRSSPTIHRTNH